MSGLSIKIESIEMEAMLHELSGRMDDLTPVMQTIGEIIVEQTDTAFETGVGPDGKAWPESGRALATGGQTLIDTAVLRNSINVLATANQVEVGTNVLYAAIHQLGGRAGRGKKTIMPARPFLPDQDSIDWVEVREALQDYLKGASA